jgi:predicted RNase H-like nuclease (RuvC/YqgF family)
LIKTFPSFKRQAQLTKESLTKPIKIITGLLVSNKFVFDQYKKAQRTNFSNNKDYQQIIGEKAQADCEMYKESLDKSENIIKQLKSENDYLQKQMEGLRGEISKLRKHRSKEYSAIAASSNLKDITTQSHFRSNSDLSFQTQDQYSRRSHSSSNSHKNLLSHQTSANQAPSMF